MSAATLEPILENSSVQVSYNLAASLFAYVRVRAHP